MKPSEITLPVTGMTCAACVRHVEKAIGRVEGVASVNVNLATERAKITTAAGVLDTQEVRGSSSLSPIRTDSA